MAKSKSRKKKNTKAVVKTASSNDKKKNKAVKKEISRTPVKKKTKTQAESKIPGFINKTRQFFREVRIELRKVNWPARKETLASTAVVIILVFLVSTYLGLVDIGLSRLIKYILQ
ncbi:MAG: preprotein translocase subunit SecE [Deltaproteobacteria bacterium]|nr:preprotein translocase subunit SecE [Deltaproteobacteria bacterium]MBW2052030.1 preprotein translocase subunit SecE [Deltaproteobacteria bacterium]MBW2140479.1 preprotein translocase subunit SecE [Deltaproteobacteria bacterium]MBW2323362.1 preprotein translocase subunit SecE [Deltaproteobacteria bacterium]